MGARERYPEGVPDKVQAAINHELALIAELDCASYFLTVYDIVRFARKAGRRSRVSLLLPAMTTPSSRVLLLSRATPVIRSGRRLSGLRRPASSNFPPSSAAVRRFQARP